MFHYSVLFRNRFWSPFYPASIHAFLLIFWMCPMWFLLPPLGYLFSSLSSWGFFYFCISVFIYMRPTSSELSSIVAICGVLLRPSNTLEFCLVQWVLSYVEKQIRPLCKFAVSEQLWNICVYPKQNVALMTSYVHDTQKELDLSFFFFIFFKVRLSY